MGDYIFRFSAWLCVKCLEVNVVIWCYINNMKLIVFIFIEMCQKLFVFKILMRDFNDLTPKIVIMIAQ